MSGGQLAKSGFNVVTGADDLTSFICKEGDFQNPQVNLEPVDTKGDGLLYRCPGMVEETFFGDKRQCVPGYPCPPAAETEEEAMRRLFWTTPRICAAKGTSPYTNPGTWERWHERLGHKSERYMKDLAKLGVVKDFRVTGEKCGLQGCSVCTLGKLART